MHKILLTSLSILALMAPAYAEDKTAATPASMDMTQAKNEKEYRAHLAGLGGLSLKASEIAVDKASGDKIKEFAKFEVSEQEAVSSVLKDMDTPKPPMSPEGQAMLDKLKSLSGKDFDKAYLQGSLDTHEKLEDLGENFLKSSKSDAMPEKHARHLATVTLPTIKQHIAQSKELMNDKD